MTLVISIPGIIILILIMIPVLRPDPLRKSKAQQRAELLRIQLYTKLRDKYPYMSDKDINKMVSTTLRIKSNHLESDDYNNKEDSYADL